MTGCGNEIDEGFAWVDEGMTEFWERWGWVRPGFTAIWGTDITLQKAEGQLGGEE